ncbi:MAG: hypothetical protein M3N32_09950 [Actinomycetota bacterium]|nr:hypothetical protein [Actinomycetota bacterium]
MAKAIVGTYADPRTIALLGEVRALRARVATLEKALEEAELALAAHEGTQVDEEQETEVRPLDPAGSVIA